MKHQASATSLLGRFFVQSLSPIHHDIQHFSSNIAVMSSSKTRLTPSYNRLSCGVQRGVRLRGKESISSLGSCPEQRQAESPDRLRLHEQHLDFLPVLCGRFITALALDRHIARSPALQTPVDKVVGAQYPPYPQW